MPNYTLVQLLIGLATFLSATFTFEMTAITRIVATAAILPANYRQRQQQMTTALQLLRQYKYPTYVFESCVTGPTFLDQYCEHVCYTKTNNPLYKNKGINEAASLAAGFKQYNFDPDDMIIKITSRYPLATDDFLKLVDHSNIDADVFVRAWDEGDVYTGLVAMRMKYWTEFLATCIDPEVMEREWIALEHRLGAYITKIRNQGVKVVYLKRVYDYLPVVTPPWYNGR